MAKKLLHTLGYDEEGNILHVENAEKGKLYICPQCGEVSIYLENVDKLKNK